MTWWLHGAPGSPTSNHGGCRASWVARVGCDYSWMKVLAGLSHLLVTSCMAEARDHAPASLRDPARVNTGEDESDPKVPPGGETR